ncbi:uncharacterized protein LOC119102986 [Pollicipes pollicipes]|uniref:uncharacterized protein LOC119102986 n=1 Tax=Pollicipes pollicipes TaxID=41117 RepID=UPI00188596FF|nr:uncharacterized protein LOC119102986 [Pollicipes pollicipes]
MLLNSAGTRAREGCVLNEIQITVKWRKGGEEIVDNISLDESAGNAFLKRMASSSSSVSASTASGHTSGGYTADASSTSKSSNGSSKRVSTLSSVTLSTIEGRGGRLSIASSMEMVPLPSQQARRASVVSVQPYSPGSDVEVIPTIPEFVSPDGRPPRPHGQPTAVSSLASAGDSLPEESQGGRPAKRVAFSQEAGAHESHVTGTSSSSPEIGELPPPVSEPDRRLTGQEEHELSEREQSQLASRALQPGLPCFAMWVDQSYYPGRLVAPGRGGRWQVQFDDGTERQVPEAQVLPVITLWSGLSVFVAARGRGGVPLGHHHRTPADDARGRGGVHRVPGRPRRDVRGGPRPRAADPGPGADRDRAPSAVAGQAGRRLALPRPQPR